MKIEGLLDTDKLENLELKLGPEEFSRFIYNFILEVESNIKEIEKSAERVDLDELMKLTYFLKIKTLKVGAILLGKEIIKVQSACLRKQKIEIIKSVKEIRNMSEKTLNAIRDILLITFCLYSCHREKNRMY
jgi:hypothetical protein